MSVENIDKFSEKMAPHLAAAKEVQSQDVLKIENDLNSRAVAWGRILNFGSQWTHQDRVKQAPTST